MLRLLQVAANGGTSGYGHDASWNSLLLLHFGDKRREFVFDRATIQIRITRSCAIAS
jgi:hypothetical protein